MAPPFGEQCCPYSGYHGQEGDDDVQHLVGEAADEVEARRRLFPIWLDPPSGVERLRLHLTRRRHTQRRSRLLDRGIGAAAVVRTERYSAVDLGGWRMQVRWGFLEETASAMQGTIAAGGQPGCLRRERYTTNDAVRRLRLPSPRVQPSHFTRRASFSTEIIKWRDFPNAIVSPLDNHS